MEMEIDDIFLVEDESDFNTVKASRCQYMNRHPGRVWFTQIKRKKDGRRYMRVTRVL